MITAEDKTATEHEAQSAGKPVVLVRELGVQEGVGHVPAMTLYNVVGGAIKSGSTVTVRSLLRQGYRVEVVE